MQQRLSHLLLAILLSVFFVGCGQMGPLYLPEKNSAAPASVAPVPNPPSH